MNDHDEWEEEQEAAASKLAVPLLFDFNSRSLVSFSKQNCRQFPFLCCIHSRWYVFAYCICSINLILFSSRHWEDLDLGGRVKTTSRPSRQRSHATMSIVPEGWEERVSKSSGKTYYLNLLTKESQWEMPTEAAVGFSDAKVQVRNLCGA